MSIDIIFNLDHPHFREPLRVRVEWKSLFLPRIGEAVNAWIWIEETGISNEEIDRLLSAEGKKCYNEESQRNFDLNNWLYELGMECSVVYSISYHKEKSEPRDVYVEMFLNDTGKFHS